MSSTHDAVYSPSHYQTESGIEAIDVIDAFFADNYYLGNVFKYLARAGKKGDKHQDLLKAQWYLDRYVDKFSKEDMKTSETLKLISDFLNNDASALRPTDEEVQEEFDKAAEEDEWDYDRALAALYDAGYGFDGVPVLRSTVYSIFEYTLTKRGEWVCNDGDTYPFHDLFSRLEDGSVEEVNPDWYALTPKGKAITELSKAGFHAPWCKNLRIVKENGWYADLLDSGTWKTRNGVEWDTETIIEILTNDDTAKLVGADKEDVE